MSVREITHHHVEGKVANLRVVVVDEPGEGGACHNYCFYSSEKNYISVIQFQNGPIQEVGVNGVQNEALLAIIIDRLEGFKNGPFPSDESTNALYHCELALKSLTNRTKDRITRGVEGISKL